MILIFSFFIILSFARPCINVGNGSIHDKCSDLHRHYINAKISKAGTYQNNVVNKGAYHQNSTSRLFDRKWKPSLRNSSAIDLIAENGGGNESDIMYDYDQFKNEYENRTKQIGNEQGGLNQTEFDIPAKSKCDPEKMLNKGPFTIACLASEYFAGKSAEEQEISRTYLLKLMWLWFLFAAVLISVGWLHYGFLNACCPFSICHPQTGYEEIKRELMLNPPGTRRQRICEQDGSCEIETSAENYKASETEYYFYNDLWNTVYRQ